MKDTGEDKQNTSILEKFKNSDNKVISLLREFLWVIIVVGAIAALLFAVSGTWPAVVTIESESMVPHMNVGDLVFVVQEDRFGPLQSWSEGKETGYTKFGDYGDVIIYNPNGGTTIPRYRLSGEHIRLFTVQWCMRNQAAHWLPMSTPVVGNTRQRVTSR